MKLAIRYYADPKIVGLPDADTELMFVRGLARAGELGREGFIPEADVPSLTRRRRYAACIDALIASRLWSRVPGGYQVNAWADWQDALDVLTKRRTTDRERKRARRLEQRQALAKRYGDRCRRCGTTENIVIDHIVPLSRGGTDDDNNKQLLCWSCNAQKRNLTEDEYTAWLAESGYEGPSPAPPSKANAGVSLSADMSPDVRPLDIEGEVDPELRGDAATHDPPRPDPYPPRTCQTHRDTDHPPPCGACADARRAHDTWQRQHANGTSDRHDHRYDGQQAAHLAAAERHMAELEQQRATPIDPAANVTRLHDVRAALRPTDPT